jgi:hypothetical protein
MFRIGNTILSDDIATANFACNIQRCKGACCVVGNAGAPVDQSEVSILRKAYEKLKSELRPEAIEVVQKEGLVKRNGRGGLELTCVDNQECVFVAYEGDVAVCSIQKAWQKGEFEWEKPISCHLYPIRLKRIEDMEFANFEYIPELCKTGCENGEKQGVGLAEFLSRPLERRYGKQWVEEFLQTCREIRKKSRK